MSATARPATTATEDIGIERKRSVTPLAASVVIAIIVASRPKSMVRTNMPGQQELDVRAGVAGTSIWPPSR